MNHNPQIWASGNANRPLEIEAKAGDNVAQISIIGRIANWSSANSGTVRRDIIALGKKYKNAKVYINTEGGSCIEANEIVNILNENFENVEVTGGAIVASAGSFILCSFKNSLSKNSQVMIHKPQGYYSGTYDAIKKQLKLLKSLENSYVGVYAEKTGKSEDDIKELWNDGDHWMTAKEAKAEGFADAIIGEAEITEEDAQAINASSSPYKVAATATQNPTQTTPNSKTKIMEQEILAVRLGLSKDATEAQIDAKLKELKDAETENAKLKTAAEKTEATARKEFFDKAEQEQRITPEARANYEALAANGGFDQVKALVEATPAVQPVSGQLNTPAKKVPGATAEFKYESYEACLKAGDDAAFEALQASDPVKAQALIDAYYEN